MLFTRALLTKLRSGGFRGARLNGIFFFPTTLDIIRIPSGYNEQLKWCNDKDIAYIFKILFAHASGEKIIVENSMRGGLLSSIIREATQMENRARARKGLKGLTLDVATLSGDSDATSRSDQVTSSNITSSKKKKEKEKEKEKKFLSPTLEEVKSYFLEKGYTKESAVRAFDYYDSGDWKDSKGNKVKNWKQKMIAVWFKDENKKPDPFMGMDRL